MLAAAGRLDLNPPAGSPASQLKMIEMPDNGKESHTIHEHAGQRVSRSVYLPLLRGVTPAALEPFDPVTQTLVTGQRATTTVPLQALYLMNSAFVRRQSLALGAKLLTEPGLTTGGRIRQAYRSTLGRDPSPQEVTRAREFLAGYEALYRARPATPAIQLSSSAAPASGAAKKPVAAGELSDDERTAQAPVAENVQPESPQAAAWMGFAQALFASAEFRFVR